MRLADPTAPVTTTASGRRLRGLDTLRGVAIALVILFHVQLHFGAPGVVGKLALLGYNGVQLFFIVSGITMCYMWAQRRKESRETTKFLIRRICRIAPPFWFAILFYMAWRHTGLTNLAPAGALDVALTALLLHGFSANAINLVVPGGWSIAVEAMFYVLFPLMVMRLTTASQRLWAAFIIYLVCTVGAYLLKREFAVDETVIYYSLLTQLPIFVVAMALYTVLFSGKPAPVKTALVIGIAWGAIAWLGRSMGWPTRPGLWAEIVLMLGFAAAILQRHEWRPLAFLGRISYSAYLFHFAVIDLLALCLPHSGGLATFALGLAGTLVGTIAVAWLSSRTLEAWAVDLGRSLVARLDASSRGAVRG
jgi:peptidoglycan/LPS O-acetylase OafA/YrhL